MMIKFATVCDTCRARSEEYAAWPACRSCGAHCCPEHARATTEADAGSPETCLCPECPIKPRAMQGLLFSGVLAGAYLRGDTRRAFLIHATIGGHALCGRVADENLCLDPHAPGAAGPATCTACLRAIRRSLRGVTRVTAG